MLLLTDKVLPSDNQVLSNCTIQFLMVKGRESKENIVVTCSFSAYSCVKLCRLCYNLFQWHAVFMNGVLNETGYQSTGKLV